MKAPRLCTAVGFFCCVFAWLVADSLTAQDVAIDSARALSRAFRKAAEKATPAVVTILGKAAPPRLADPEEMRRLMQDPNLRQLLPEGLLPDANNPNADAPPAANVVRQIGAGVVLDKAGVILTNAHVVMGAQEVVVRLPDGDEIQAVKVLTDPLSDIAVVQVETDRKFVAATLGAATEMEIGDWVIAIGSPFALEATVSAGIISGKGRGISRVRRGKLLQTDAAINPGNSGGPLVNLDGDVIAINTAIATFDGGYQGIGFAIPIERARWISAELLKHGEVRRAYLGIAIDELTANAAQKLGRKPRSGALVVDVRRNGPAETAGIRRNDVIIEFADQQVLMPRDLQDLVEQKQIGSEQPLKVWRNNEVLSLEVEMKQAQDPR